MLIVYFFTNKPNQNELAAIKDDGTFIEGVSVNGVDLSGMSYSQAREAILPSVQTDLESINITVSHGTMLWLLTAADMKVTSMLDAVLTDAIALGRSGTIIQNNTEKEDVLTRLRRGIFHSESNEKSEKKFLQIKIKFLSLQSAKTEE